MTGQLKISPELSLPLDAVTETLGILAVKRAGKSNAAVVIAEDMYDNNIPWVAIDPKGDWWGVRAAGDGEAPGLSVLVFGGLHGDVPLEPTAGRLVADLVVDERLTCVLDVSEMSKADQRRLLRDFAQRLYRRNTEPLHLFCEEADEYIPQMVRGDDAQVVGAFETLVKRGGFKGIGVTLITQRSASLNKDVLTQVGTLFVLRTTSPQDRKAIQGWIQYHAEADATLAELPTLANGEAFVYSPEWLRQLTRIQFRRRRTFDSGATPKIGGKPRPPARLADVDLAAIKEAMAETIERAAADDPKTLRTEIARLKRDLAAKPTSTVELVEVPVVTDAGWAALSDMTERYELASKALAESHLTIINALMKLDRVSNVKPPLTVPGSAGTVGTANIRTPMTRPIPASPTGPVEPSTLGKTERNVLTVLVQHGPLTNSQIALLAGYSVKASTIGVALSKLRNAGYVGAGQPVAATPAGVDWIGSAVEPLPQGADLLEYWRNRFGMTERNVLDVVLAAYPGESSQLGIAEATGYSAKASTIGVALSKLRKVGVVERWRISDDFASAVGLS